MSDPNAAAKSAAPVRKQSGPNLVNARAGRRRVNCTESKETVVSQKGVVAAAPCSATGARARHVWQRVGNSAVPEQKRGSGAPRDTLSCAGRAAAGAGANAAAEASDSSNLDRQWPASVGGAGGVTGGGGAARIPDAGARCDACNDVLAGVELQLGERRQRLHSVNHVTSFWSIGNQILRTKPKGAPGSALSGRVCWKEGKHSTSQIHNCFTCDSSAGRKLSSWRRSADARPLSTCRIPQRQRQRQATKL